ncbi:MAG: DNA-3-methyladenine glycosylase I, partial [Bacteroidetes bacterium]|nr:DNA-3-methyladenine glycosylase I [Bacteroidota bacterium]
MKRLLANSKIVRHRIKILSIIFNAQKILQIQQEFGSFYQWLIINERKTMDDWSKLLKKNF